MTKTKTQSIPVVQIAGAIMGWLAVILQGYLILKNRTESVDETLIRFFTFFTILTNILVAFSQTVLWLRPQSGVVSYFAKPNVQTALAVYIIVVGLIYNIILRFLWEPQGLQMWVDEALHTINPFLFLIYWIWCVRKNGIHWYQAFVWLLYPAFYLAMVLWRGGISGYYPYPFLDVSKLGTQLVSYNCVGIFFVFLFISFLLILVSRLSGRKA